MGATEEVLFEERGVQVTTTKAAIHGTTYLLRDVTSVRAHRMAPPFLLPGAMGALGILMALCGLPMAITGVRQLIEPMFMVGLTALLVGGMLVLAGVGLLMVGRPTFAVMLGTGTGERRVLRTEDEDFAERVRAALEAAMTRQG
jgi:hypothetical protein